MPGNDKGGVRKAMGSIYENAKNGRKYFKISLNSEAVNSVLANPRGYLDFIAFPNDYKNGDETQPDLKVYISQPKSSPAPKRAATKQTQQRQAAPKAPVQSNDDDEFTF